MKKFITIALAMLFIASCANKGDRISKREARLKKETAFSLGIDPSDVQISNLSGNMYGYRWQAKTNIGTYNCSMMGGNAMTFGMTAIPPQCNKVAGGGATKAKKSKKK